MLGQRAKRRTVRGRSCAPPSTAEPLGGLADHRLDEFDLRLVAVRRYGNVAVVLAESAQRGTRSGQRWEHTFRHPFGLTTLDVTTYATSLRPPIHRGYRRSGLAPGRR